ncbi:hypothetical protein JG687_00013023, partial [Phytophthora cactorum]
DSSLAASSSSSSPTSNDSTLSTGAIAGVAIGAAVIMAVIIALVCCIRGRRNKGGHPNTPLLQDPFIVRGSGWTGGVTVDSELSTQGSGLWNDHTIIATRVRRDQ